MELKDIKQQFFTYRNGILADRLRSAGDCHSVIFGLNLPQIADIAKMAGTDKTLAEQLWDNTTTRESRLIAPMIYPREQFCIAMAREWIESVENTEVADIL
ncbi:MAG: DNA alkylation repair protein, partial [Muribaculaceae bacterium]